MLSTILSRVRLWTFVNARTWSSATGRRSMPFSRIGWASTPSNTPGFYDTRSNAERTKRNHIRQLEALDYKVTLQPAA
jgi:hypothetical protein